MTLGRVGEIVRATFQGIVARESSAPASEVLASVERRAGTTDAARVLNASG